MSIKFHSCNSWWDISDVKLVCLTTVFTFIVSSVDMVERVTWLLTDGLVFSAGRLKLTAWTMLFGCPGLSAGCRPTPWSFLLPGLHLPPLDLFSLSAAQEQRLMGRKTSNLHRLWSHLSAENMAKYIDFCVFLLWWLILQPDRTPVTLRNHWSPQKVLELLRLNWNPR